MENPMVDWTDLIAVLNGIRDAVLVPVVLGALWSWLAENIPAWHDLAGRVKFVAGLVLSGALPLAAAIVLMWMKEQPIAFTPEEVYKIVAQGVVAWVTSQGAYMLAKTRGYGAKR